MSKHNIHRRRNQSLLLGTAIAVASLAGCVDTGEIDFEDDLSLQTHDGEEISNTSLAVSNDGLNVIYDAKQVQAITGAAEPVPHVVGNCQIWRATENIHTPGDGEHARGVFYGTGDCESVCRSWRTSYSTDQNGRRLSYRQGSYQTWFEAKEHDYYSDALSGKTVAADKVCHVSDSGDFTRRFCPEVPSLWSRAERRVYNPITNTWRTEYGPAVSESQGKTECF